MLTTKRVSRVRSLSGSATITLIIAAGLGLTASGTAAVAAARATVEQATGVDLGSSAPATPAVTPAPPAAVTETPDPATPPSPAASPSAAAVAETPAGPNMVRRVKVTKDGKTTIYDHADVDAHLAAHDRVEILPLDPHGSRMIVKNPDDPDGRIEIQDIPAVSSANCGIGTGEPTSMVVDGGKGHKRKIVICTDRIQKVAAEGAAMAMNSKDIERNAYRQALTGLRKARAEMIAKQGDSGHAAEALPAIDTAIAEIESDLAKVE